MPTTPAPALLNTARALTVVIALSGATVTLLTNKEDLVKQIL